VTNLSERGIDDSDGEEIEDTQDNLTPLPQDEEPADMAETGDRIPTLVEDDRIPTLVEEGGSTEDDEEAERRQG
jgi:hypothetical protein